MLENRWQKSYERWTLTSQLTPTRRKRWYRVLIKHLRWLHLCIMYINEYSPVQTTNVWRSHTMNYSMLRTHFGIWTTCLMVFNKIWTTSNIWSNIVKHVWYHSGQHYQVWSLNNVWSCLVAKHFSFEQCLTTISKHYLYSLNLNKA